MVTWLEVPKYSSQLFFQTPSQEEWKVLFWAVGPFPLKLYRMVELKFKKKNALKCPLTCNNVT